MASNFVLSEEGFLAIDKSLQRGIDEIEKSFGHLYHDGKVKTVQEPEREKLREVNKKLDELRCEICRFQSDLRKVCSEDTGQLKVPERRATTKGARNDRDSGYSSDFRLSLASNTSDQSTNRLSKAEPQDLEHISSDEAELYNPSGSSSDSSFSNDRDDVYNKPQFYIKGVDSETSLSDFNEKNQVDYTYDDESVPNVHVESTNESNQLCTGPDTLKERFVDISHERRSQEVNSDEGNPAERQNNDADDNYAIEVIEGHSDTVNKLSKPSSEEDNTKYAE